MSSRTRLEWAQWMAAKGISAFILSPKSKKPLEGRSWYLRQTIESETLAAWFEQTPECNYGVHLGEDYVVIDLDVKPEVNGIREFETICAENGIEDFRLELDTLMVKTPGGGYHLYFRSPFPCANKNDFPYGIDVRGTLGYVVGPGSYIDPPPHPQAGHDYEVVDEAADIIDLPEWLEDYLQEPGRKDPNAHIPVVELDLDINVQHALDWLKERDPAVIGKNGNDYTYETVQFLRDFGLSETKAHEVINVEWNQRCDPPWGDLDLEACITNAYRYGENRPGVKSPSYRIERINLAHGKGAVTQLTPEQIAEMFHPTHNLKLVVDNDPNSEIPDDVSDDYVDDVTGETVDALPSIFSPWSEFTAQQEVRQYVIYNWLIAHGISHMIAVRGTGKSTVALNMACHIACDMDWCDIPTKTGWKVIYICGEDDVSMRLNCRAWEKHYGARPADDRFLIASDIIKLTDDIILNLRIQEMMAWVGDDRCIVILDTWQRATAGYSKIDSTEMELAVERAERIAKHVNGPLLSCVHPPKDGRMTVIGSGVQEDTSSAIYHLTEEADGVKLMIDRMKGPGERNYMKFALTPVTLEGLDDFNRPLTGLIAAKIGGSEDKNTVEAADREEREMRAWANAIRGVQMFSHEGGEGIEEVNTLNIKNIAIWLSDIAAAAHEHTHGTIENYDAINFEGRYLGELKAILSKGLLGMSKSIITRTLTDLFNRATPPTTTTTGGLLTMEFKPKATEATQAKKLKPGEAPPKPQRVFVFTDTPKVQ